MAYKPKKYELLEEFREIDGRVMAQVRLRSRITYILESGELALPASFSYVSKFQKVGGDWVAVARFPSGRTYHITPDGHSFYKSWVPFCAVSRFEKFEGYSAHAYACAREEEGGSIIRVLLINSAGINLVSGAGISTFHLVDGQPVAMVVRDKYRDYTYFINPNGESVKLTPRQSGIFHEQQKLHGPGLFFENVYMNMFSSSTA